MLPKDKFLIGEITFDGFQLMNMHMSNLNPEDRVLSEFLLWFETTEEEISHYFTIIEMAKHYFDELSRLPLDTKCQDFVPKYLEGKKDIEFAYKCIPGFKVIQDFDKLWDIAVNNGYIVESVSQVPYVTKKESEDRMVPLLKECLISFFQYFIALGTFQQQIETMPKEYRKRFK